jgi:hypothetical protein
MAQETFYFPHDYNPLDDCKLKALIGTYGAVGYGIFWRVVEKLHSNNENKLPMKQYLYIAIGQEMSTPPETVEEIIMACIDPFELFINNGDFFWSNRVDKNIIKRKEVVKQKSDAGKASAKARKRLQQLAEKYPDLDISDLTGVQQPSTGVQRVSTVVEQPSTKERKVKERI